LPPHGAALSGEIKDDGKLAVVIAPRNADTLILEPAEDKLQDRTPYSGHAEN
jgi:hypothetical protein